MYISLHNHTSFSIMDSLIKPADLFKRAKELGQTAVGITDHGSCAGLWDSLKESKQTGVKLIAGCEFYFTPNLEDRNSRLSHLILLAKNDEGYKNLLTALKVGYDNYVVSLKKSIPRIDWNILEKYKEGLFCTTACANGILGQIIADKKFDEAKQFALKLKNIFGDNVFIELQPNAVRRKANAYSVEVDQVFINRQLKKIAEEVDIKCIIATNAHYVNKEDYQTHDVMLAIASGQPIASGARLKYNDDFYIKSEEEVFAKISRNFGEEFTRKCIENTEYIASQCEFPSWIDPKYSNPSGKELPEFPVKDQPDYEEFKKWVEGNDLPFLPEPELYLRRACEIELEKKTKSGELNFTTYDKYKERLYKEIEVLEFKGFSSYMLIVSDYISWARAHGVMVGPGRGSGGNSLVGNLLGIHRIDPIKYGLIFERFINREKEEFPDLDVDFACGRDLVKDYVSNKYGSDNVAHVSNINTLTPKPYIKYIARTFEYGGDRKTALAIGNVIADSVPAEIKTIKQALEDAPLFAEYAKKYKELVTYAELCGKAVAWSTHAGGVIIGKRSLAGLVPLRRDKDGSVAIEYEKKRAEANGLLKMDFLGVKTLEVVDNCNKMIASLGKQPPAEPFNYEQEDEKTYNMISNGNTFGVFQFGTSGGTIDLCKKIKPKNLDDLAIINSLARPAARDIRKDYIKTRNGEIPVKILHDSLKRAFGPTLGFGIFEESLMYLAQDVAGWDLLKADRLRKLTKEKGKDPEKAKVYREDFIKSSIENGISKKMATKIWDEIIAGWSGYGFNKSLYFLQYIDIYTMDGKFVSSKPIKDIKPGEFVRSRDEMTGSDIFVEILKLHDHGELETVEVSLDTGETIICTMNHKFRVRETGEMLPLCDIIYFGYSIVMEKYGTT